MQIRGLPDALAQNDTFKLTREFLRLMGSGADAAEIANLFREKMEPSRDQRPCH
jgi:hypothetical protein